LPDLLKNGPNGEKTVAAVLKIAQMGAKIFDLQLSSIS
jgi:hypothetical protein